MISSITGMQAASYVQSAKLGATPAKPQGAEKAASPASAFESFARKYDVRSMTPSEIDEMVEEMPVETASDRAAKMALITYGESFQRGLSASIAEATGVDGSAELEQALSRKIDLIESFETSIAMSKRLGESSEALESALSYLNRMDARRHLPESGVTV